MRLKTILALLVLMGALTACGDDGGGGPSADVAEDPTDDTVDAGFDVPDQDAVEDPVADVTDEDASEFVPNEVEPNGYDSPQEITLPATIRGVIGAPEFDAELGYEMPDSDIFHFTGTAGTVVRLTLSVAEIDPYVFVTSAEEEPEVEIYRELSGDTPGLTRQIFIPADGAYEIAVDDFNNLLYLYGYADTPVGGDGYIYELSVEVDAASPVVNATLTDAVVSATFNQTGLPTGNGVEIYEITTDGGLLVADVDAQTLDPPSDLDPALILMSGDRGTFVAENDDENYGAELYDSLLRVEVDGSTTYTLVLDFYSAGENNAHDLTLTLADPHVELEPNNDSGTAWALPVTGDSEPIFEVAATIGEPVEGGAGEDDTPDMDWYLLGSAEEGQSAVITVTPGASSLLQPRVFVGTVVEGLFGPEFAVTSSAMYGPDGTARLEATALSDGEYYAVVADARNFAPADAGDSFVLDAVGGDDYDYVIHGVQFERTVTDLGSSLPITDHAGELTPAGNVDWYKFATGASAEGMLIIRTVAAHFEPVVLFFDATAPEGGDERPVGEWLEVGDSLLVLGDVQPSSIYKLAIMNEGEWPASPDTAAYDLSIEVANPTPTSETSVGGGDFPDETASAYDVAGTQARFVGDITGTDDTDFDADVFAFSLFPGERLFAETYAPADSAGTTDTVLELSGLGLDEPIVNDDTNGFYSRIVYDMPDDATTTDGFLTVFPYCGSSGCYGGDYGLTILILGR